MIVHCIVEIWCRIIAHSNSDAAAKNLLSWPQFLFQMAQTQAFAAAKALRSFHRKGAQASKALPDCARKRSLVGQGREAISRKGKASQATKSAAKTRRQLVDRGTSGVYFCAAQSALDFLSRVQSTIMRSKRTFAGAAQFIRGSRIL